MTEEQIEGLSDNEAKAKAAEVVGGDWYHEDRRGATASLGRSLVFWSEKHGWEVSSGDFYEGGTGTIGDASRAFLRCYYSGEITLPGRPAWAPLLRRLKAAGFSTARLMTLDGIRVVDMGEAFRIAMGVE